MHTAAPALRILPRSDACPVQQASLAVAQASFVALLQEHQLLDSATLSFFHLSFFGVQLFWCTSVPSKNIVKLYIHSLQMQLINYQ